MRELAVRFRAPIPPDFDVPRLLRVLYGIIDGPDQELAVDMVDATLDVLGPDQNGWQTLQKHLDAGASAWKVADDHISLTQVVSDEVQATFDAATSVADDITTEMEEAWSNAFGRNGNPSDAWDHAIKALDALFIPLVVPSQTKPNLGHAVGQLRNQGHLYELVLPGKNLDHDVAPLVGMLDVIWPNVDRHPGVPTTLPPTVEEARAVVTLAATIVHWHRDGWVVQRR